MDPTVEELLVRAERITLRLLSPLVRAVIVSLKLLSEGAKSIEEVRERCGIYGFKCRLAEKAVSYLESIGLATCGENVCSLTGEGLQLAEALKEVEREIREYAYSVVEGKATEIDVFSQMATPLASAVGVVESVSEDPDSLTIALAIHAYVSTLVVTVSSLLVRIRPSLIDLMRSVYGGRS